MAKKKTTEKDGFVIEGNTPNLGADDCAVIIRSSGKMEVMVSTEPPTGNKSAVLTRYYAQLCAWAVANEGVQEQFLAMAQAKMQALKEKQTGDKHTTDDNSAGNDDDDGTSLN